MKNRYGKLLSFCALSALILSLVVGCGQKGDLYLPSDTSDTSTTNSEN